MAHNSAKNMKTIIIIYISILECKNTFFYDIAMCYRAKKLNRCLTHA